MVLGSPGLERHILIRPGATKPLIFPIGSFIPDVNVYLEVTDLWPLSIRLIQPLWESG